MPKPPQTHPKVVQAIEDIREMVDLATSDLEQAMGGPLTHEAMHAIRNWIARAYEAGQKHGKTRNVK